jgi:hypothetical protein
MGFDQYHEPANELPQEVRTFARMIASLFEKMKPTGCWHLMSASIPLASKPRQEKLSCRVIQTIEIKVTYLLFYQVKSTFLQAREVQKLQRKQHVACIKHMSGQGSCTMVMH